MYADVLARRLQFQMQDLDRQIGLQQLMTALTFCHDSARLVHGNVSPEDVYITARGDWVLGGFHFSVHTAYTAQQEAQAAFPVRAVSARWTAAFELSAAAFLESLSLPS